MLVVSGKVAQTAEFIDCCVLVKTFIALTTKARNHLNIDLDTFPGICHLLIWLWRIALLFGLLRQLTEPP